MVAGTQRVLTLSHTSLPLQVQDFTLYNNGNYNLDIYTAGGSDCSRAVPLSPFSRWTSVSSGIQISNAPCTTSPCCVIVYCRLNNALQCSSLFNTGSFPQMRFSNSFRDPTVAPGAALSGGSIAGLVIGILIFVAVVVVIGKIARQRRSPYSSSAGQASTVVVVSGS